MWTFNNKEFTEDMIDNHVGFVYRITNLTDGRDYIGKKLFKFLKTKQVNKKKKKVRVASDWLTYFSSSEELKKDVDLLGKDNFKREILRLCMSKGEMSYFEAKFQFSEDVLINPNSYNSWISCKIHKSHLTKLKK